MMLVDFILHLDQHLLAIVSYLGVWFYLLMFLVIFAETGLIVTPFLPGDSLLFALGALSAIGSHPSDSFEGPNVFVLGVSLTIAAILGDTLNFKIGSVFGAKILEKKKIPFVKEEHLQMTREFFDRHGNKTIFLARFAPIARTFAPFLAGVGGMNYGIFMLYNWIGALVWVPSFLFLGYFFGNLPWVKQQFHWITLSIVIISILPIFWGYIQNKRKKSLQ